MFVNNIQKTGFFQKYGRPYFKALFQLKEKTNSGQKKAGMKSSGGFKAPYIAD